MLLTNELISLLIDRCQQNALENIFEKLDEQSLYNAKLVSKKWKAAISEANPTQLWKKLLHEKVCIWFVITFPFSSDSGLPKIFLSEF